MKKKWIRYIAIAVINVLIFLPSGASAQVDRQLVNKYSSVLVKLGVMEGDNSGNLHLDREVKRCEFVTMVIRMMGYDRDTDLDSVSLSFKDVASISGWAVDYIKLALKYGLIEGYNDNTVRPNNVVSNAEALTIIIRALGYEGTLQGGWPDATMSAAASLGLSNNFDVPPAHKLTRGETALIIYNALTVCFHN